MTANHGELLFGFIDVCNQVANGPDAGKLDVHLEVYDEPATILSDTSFTLKGKLLGTGGKVKLGERAEEVFRYPVFRGVWQSGRSFILEDYSQSDFEQPDVPTYKETQQKMLDTVIIQPLEDAWQRVVDLAKQGIETVLEVGGKIIRFAADAVASGKQIIVSVWNLFTGGQGKPLLEGSPEYAIAERILTQAQEQAGLQFGIGGFVNLQTEDGLLAGTATMTFGYSDSDVTGVDESRLAVFWYDPDDGEWVYVGGVADPQQNQVFATVDRLGTFTLAPIHPEGSIGMNATPPSIAAGGEETVVVCGPLVDSAGDPVADDTAYTVTTDLGEIVAQDQVPDASGLQVFSSSGELSFSLRSSTIAGIASLRVESLAGRAVGEATVEFTDDEPPAAPQGVVVKADDEGAWLYWGDNAEPDIAGYRIHFGTEAGGPYDGGASIRGLPSPVDVGFATQAYLPGLINRTEYHVVITALDHGGNESPGGEEVSVLPTVKGDCDGDGNITEKDLLNFSYGFGALADDPDYVPLADVNGDRQIDEEDVLSLLSAIESPAEAQKARQKQLLRELAW
ncbi:hypothetical protein HS125_05525 [bacterium]|nr:hypothetical protein [bacterium]